MDQNKLHDLLISICKDVEIYIQNDSNYKGDIICGNFATRFNRLIQQSEHFKALKFQINVLEAELKNITQDRDLAASCWADEKDYRNQLEDVIENIANNTIDETAIEYANKACKRLGINNETDLGV